MKIVAILQARTNSTRLPGKVMLPLAGKSMVQNILERVQRAKRLHEAVIAPSWRDHDAFPGLPVIQSPFIDEMDLVGRHLHVAAHLHADIVVRVPCDNPCVDPEYIDQAIEAYLAGTYIFYTNTVTSLDGVTVDGLGCEVFSGSRLKILDVLTKDRPDYREHPHKWFHDHLRTCDAETQLRLDVNTREDYDFIASIYNHFGHNRFTAQEILACPPVQERLHGRR